MTRTLGLHAGVIAILMLTLTSCGGSESSGDGSLKPSAFRTPYIDDKVYPVFVSSEVTVGKNRFLVGLLNDQDAPIGSPNIDMHIEFFDLQRSASKPVTGTDMRWVWTDKPRLGLYASNVLFDEPGTWGAEVSVEGEDLDATVRGSFEVREEGSTPALGERVPSVDTPTASNMRGIRQISTDDHPDPRFYRSSISGALQAGHPFAVVFATPKFCSSRACGPVLDTVKRVADQTSNFTFIHVEPYQLPAEPTHLEPVRSALRWGLPSEPWVFVVDRHGRLTAKFEGALSAAELKAAISRLR